MAGFTNIGAIEALPDHAGASLVDRPLSLMREAIKRLVLELGPDIIGDDPDVAAAAVAAVADAVTGMNLLPVTRGTLPDGTDLNSVNSASMAGAWRMAASNTYLNLPDGFTLTSAAVLVVTRTDNGNGVTQQLTHGRRNFWRKTNLPSTWFAWSETVATDALSGFMPIMKGEVPDGADLDDYRQSEHAGVWMLRAAASYENAPFELVSAGVLVVLPANSTNAVVQLAWAGYRHAWREANHATVWFPWVGSGDGFLLSTSPYAYIREGQTLYVYDPEFGETNFENDREGWTDVYGTVNGSRVFQPAFESQNALDINQSTEAVMVWDEYDGFTDGEIAMHGLVNVAQPYRTLAVAARFTNMGDTNGYVCGIVHIDGAMQCYIGKFVDGTYSLVNRLPVDVEAGVPFMLRFRVEGESLMGKAWSDETQEPAAWSVIATDDSHAVGGVGLLTGGVLNPRWVEAFTVDQRGE